MHRRMVCVLAMVFAAMGAVSAPAAFNTFVTVSNGYFWSEGAPWVPHGIAYQTWNRPLGVWQTPDQIDYDLNEMVKAGGNSIRVDFVWQHIEEKGDNIWSWDNYDYLLQACEARNIRVFALVGYQWPPGWFPDDWYTMHPPGYDTEWIYHTNRWQSDIIGYETPAARAQYSNFLYTVCNRYKDSKAIAGWIVGNEYGYLGLWSLKYDGYDTNCEAAYRTWLSAKYVQITNLNNRWGGTTFTNFSQIGLMEEYAWKGTNGAAWADTVQWHEDSIASFTALGAKAARNGDTNHLLSYSTVGMQWGEEDWRYHAEDRGKIAAACASNNAALAFFSINNYPWSLDGHETRNGQWGVSFTKKVAKMPVLYTETGFTSSETLWPGMDEVRQGPLIRNAIWEGLEAGAIGTHIFTWQDRPWITDREKGFGIVYGDRAIKPAYWVCRDAHNLMDTAKLPELLRGSADAKPDIAFLWTAANDSQYIRYENEMQHEAGALERLGFEPNFMSLEDLGAGAFTNYRVIILPRNMRVDAQVPGYTNSVLNFLLKNVIASGVHVLAVADLPGQQDAWGKSRAAFTNEVRALFGIDASDVGACQPKGGMSDSIYWDFYHYVDVLFTTNAPAGLPGYAYSPNVWKYNDRIRVADGTLWATMDARQNWGFESSSVSLPAWGGTWGSYEIRNWFPYEGTNMLRMWGEAGAWHNMSNAIAGEKYSARAYLRSNSDDPLRGGAYARVDLEWYNEAGGSLGSVAGTPLAGPTPGNAWVEYVTAGIAPANAAYARTVLRTATNAPSSVLLNGALTGTGDAPDNWSQWTTTSHDPDTTVYRSSPNSWSFWWDGGIYQDVTASNGFVGGDSIKFEGYLLTPTNDPLRNGTKYGVIQVEFYNATNGLISTFSASPTINSNSTKGSWIYSSGTATVPTNAAKARVLVRCNDYASGDGTFRADDVALLKPNAAGSCYFDGDTRVPAVVVKNQGTAKAAIALYAMECSPDSNGDGSADNAPYKWRYDVLGGIIKDYFGVQPKIYATGTNAYLCLPEYRTSTNGAILMQVKNYLYNVAQGGGGPGLTFTINSSLVTGKTIRAFEQGKVIEQNSDGVFTLSLAPDGHEIVYAYTPGATKPQVIQIVDAPAVVHPFGNNSYGVKIKYDCVGSSNLYLKTAFQEVGDNGDGVTNEIYVSLTNAISGSAFVTNYLFIPDYTQSDSDYKSTPEGGRYQFVAWIETNSTKMVEATPASTQLKWGVRPTTNVPVSLAKGQTVSMGLKWEELYETLYWQNTPLAREGAFPNRIAVFRSSKTESQFPGHFNKVNEVCNWLESLGFANGEPMDLMFDNVLVEGKVTNNFNAGNYSGWARSAGCANWTVEDSSGLSSPWGSQLKYAGNTTFPLSNALRQVSYRIKADASKTIDKVSIYASKAGASPTFQLGLYADNAGVPMGTPLVSVNFTVATNAAHWEAIDLPNYAWSAGTYYHLVLSYVSGAINSTNSVTPQYITPSSNGRNVLTSTNAGAAWTSTGYDPAFRIQYSDGLFVQPYASVTTLNVTNKLFYGQRFTPPISVSVTNLGVWMRKASTANGSILMNVRRWSDKALIATAQVAAASVATTNNWVRFAFPSSFAVPATNTYFFELRHVGTTGIYYVTRQNVLGSIGTNGWGGTNDCDVYSLTTGATWVCEGQYDLGFQLYATTTNRALRAWRVGNDENILVYTNAIYTNVTVSTDIRYTKQGNYFNDAELYTRFQNRDNYYKVGIRNYYGAWRIRFVVETGGSIQQQGWLWYFAKTNRPVENTWYNLKVSSIGSTNQVYFNNTLVGTFWATNFASGRVAVGTKATQLGVSEPQKGYFFIDDDEYGMTGLPLNMDWGYLKSFFPSLVLPSVYVMNDAEASNLVTYMNSGLFSVFATDGGVARKNETGADDLGRVEGVFGVSPAVAVSTNLIRLVTGGNGHYVTLDYTPGSLLSITNNCVAYNLLTSGKSQGTVTNKTEARPALIVNTTGPDPVGAPARAFAFNFGADTFGQLTNNLVRVAQRAFEWTRGQALKVRVELKFHSTTTNSVYEDFVVCGTDTWIFAGSGQQTVTMAIPTNGIMTGDNLYWAIYTYPWDATNAFLAHNGFYTSANDGTNVVLPGVGLQILGITDYAYAGRDWDKWVAYNTRTQSFVFTFGCKDKGLIFDQDNFEDGDYAGWNVTSNNNISWGVSNRMLRATVTSTGGYSYIVRNGFALNNTNITIEYDTRFNNGARDGGLVYRGRVLYVSPNRCGWDDLTPNYVTTNVTTGILHHVVVSVRTGTPYLKSDLYVDNNVVFRDEPIQVSTWTTNTFGFLSPYSNAGAYVEWDNTRLADEEYAVVWTNAFGISYPTNGLPTLTWPSLVDYDPAMQEHRGTVGGAQYEWFCYFRGTNVGVQKDVRVYFAPRLLIEQANFPTNVKRGQTYGVPLFWQDIYTNLPAKLWVGLEEPYAGTNFGFSVYDIYTSTGTGTYYVTVSNNAPASSNYLWVAYLYPPFATNPMLQRLGLDDTYRFSPEPRGKPIGPETRITLSSDSDIYSDAGIPTGTEVFQWAGGGWYFDGNYTTASPEGVKCFYTWADSWAGWGVFNTNRQNMSAYSNGWLKFWLKSSQQLRVELEGPQGTKNYYYCPSTTNNWLEFSVNIKTNFPSVVLTNMFGLFEITAEGATTNYVDYVRWTLTP